MSKKIRVVVVEDNRLLRDGLATLLDAQGDIKVVAAAEDPDAGVRQVQETKPHVLLVDASLGGHGSHRFVEQVRTVAPEVKVIVMDLLPVEEDVVEFVKAGVAGFIAKHARTDDLVAAVRSVAGGAQVVLPSLTGALFSYIAREAGDRAASTSSDSVRLSKREVEVIDLIAEGLSNKDIARRLNLATDTVKSHVHNILEKLALHNRLQIAAHARTLGLHPKD